MDRSKKTYILVYRTNLTQRDKFYAAAVNINQIKMGTTTLSITILNTDILNDVYAE